MSSKVLGGRRISREHCKIKLALQKKKKKKLMHPDKVDYWEKAWTWVHLLQELSSKLSLQKCICLWEWSLLLYMQTLIFTRTIFYIVCFKNTVYIVNIEINVSENNAHCLLKEYNSTTEINSSLGIELTLNGATTNFQWTIFCNVTSPSIYSFNWNFNFHM